MPQVFQPFQNPQLNTVEVLSELTLLIGLQLAMLWRDPLFSEPDSVQYLVLTVGFLTINALLLCMFAVVILHMMGKKVRVLLTRRIQEKARLERRINSASTTHSDQHHAPHKGIDLEKCVCGCCEWQNLLAVYQYVRLVDEVPGAREILLGVGLVRGEGVYDHKKFLGHGVGQ